MPQGQSPDRHARTSRPGADRTQPGPQAGRRESGVSGAGETGKGPGQKGPAPKGRAPKAPGASAPAPKGSPRKAPGPHGSVLALLVRLLSYVRHHWVLFVVVLSVSVLTAVLGLLPPWVIRLAVDRIVHGQNGARLVWIALALMLLAVIAGTADFFRLYLAAQLGQRVVYRIRTALFAHLSRLSFSFYDSARTGDLVSRTTADVDMLSQFFGRSATIILTNILFLVGIFAVLVSWRSGLTARTRPIARRASTPSGSRRCGCPSPT